MNGLARRLARLEVGFQSRSGTERCRGCGLPHARLPLPAATAERIVRHALGASSEPPERLCPCLGCCTEGQEIARLTHGLPVVRSA